jgi:4-amino-4-deoxy-L-arabinose transferase-like glycosyltransferase
MSTSEYPARVGGAWLPRVLAAVRARPITADIWILAALIAVAAVIRLLAINNQSFWQDEALTSYETRISFGAMINTVIHFETTPPLYFVVIWVWAHLFGSGEVALRMVSTLAGIALVPITYFAGRELVSRRAGTVAATLIALNPFLIWYSQEARAYMLLAALAGASFLCFVRARQDPSPRNLAWWAIWSSLALMTHFFAGFLVAPEALWLLWISRTRSVGLAVGAVAVVQASMLPFAAIDTNAAHGAGWIAAIPKLQRLGEAIAEWGVSIMYRRATTAEALLAGAAFLAAVALLLALRGDRRTREGAAVAAVIAGAVWIAPLVLAKLGQDYFLSRNVMPAVAPGAVLVAAACVVPRARLLGGALAVALLAVFAYAAVRVQSHAYLQRPNWRAVAHALGPSTVPRAVLAADGTTAQPLKIYMPGVNWVRQPAQKGWIREVDIVGATKGLPLRQVRRVGPRALIEPLIYTPIGSPVPRSISVPGARLMARFRVKNWILARFVLSHPVRASVNDLIELAPRYFRRTPRDLLVFFQPRPR